MFFDPKFLKSGGTGGGADSGLLIHEDPAQLIQGGKPGEHYHLDLAEYTAVGEYIFLEPVTAGDEIVFDSSGDIVWSTRE